jgi:hypothetical protein
VRPLIVTIAALVVGCGHPADPKHAGSPPARPTKISGTGQPAPSGSGAGGDPVSVVPDIGCPAPTCVFHAGAGAYFTCLAGGAGTCFHFGATCAPADLCMYDPAGRSYKQCARAGEGVCMKWGAACVPPGKCMFTPADGLHHRCEEVADGGCKRYGALCAP